MNQIGICLHKFHCLLWETDNKPVNTTFKNYQCETPKEAKGRRPKAVSCFKFTSKVKVQERVTRSEKVREGDWPLGHFQMRALWSPVGQVKAKKQEFHPGQPWEWQRIKHLDCPSLLRIWSGAARWDASTTGSAFIRYTKTQAPQSSFLTIEYWGPNRRKESVSFKVKTFKWVFKHQEKSILNL